MTSGVLYLPGVSRWLNFSHIVEVEVVGIDNWIVKRTQLAPLNLTTKEDCDILYDALKKHQIGRSVNDPT